MGGGATETPSTGVERTRPVMALAASNRALSSMPVVVLADSQLAQAAVTYSYMLHTIAM